MIGARFGFELTHLLRDHESQGAQHVVQHVVRLIGHDRLANLDASVAITQVVRGAGNVTRRRANNGRKHFFTRFDAEDFPGLGQQMVAVAKGSTSLEKDHDVVTTRRVGE